MLEQQPVLQHSCCRQRFTWHILASARRPPAQLLLAGEGRWELQQQRSRGGAAVPAVGSGTQRLCTLRRCCPPAVRMLPSLETHPQIWGYACSRCCASAPGGLLTRAPAAGVCLQPLLAAGICSDLLAGALHAAVLCLCQLWYLPAGGIWLLCHTAGAPPAAAVFACSCLT